MRIDCCFYATAFTDGEPPAQLSIEQCRAAGLENIGDPDPGIIEHIDDPLIRDEGLLDAGVSFRIENTGAIRTIVAFRCLARLDGAQLDALCDYVRGQLSDGYGEPGFAADTPIGPVRLEFLLRDGAYDRSVSVEQIDDGVAVPDRRTPPSVRAAEAGDLAALIAALDNGCPVDATGRFDMTALMIAARDGHTKLVDCLIARNADVNANFGAALELAAMCGHTEIAGALIKAGAHVNLTRPETLRDPLDDRNSALHWAANRGHPDVAALLIEAGADVNALNRSGETALHMTSSVDVARVLIGAGIDVGLVSAEGRTALQSAMYQASFFESIGSSDGAVRWREIQRFLSGG